MERTKYKKSALTNNQLLHTFASQLVSRMSMATRMGMQFGGTRDIYKALGYIRDPQFTDFLGRYKHHDIAKAIIDRPVNATWQGPIDLIESDESKDTELEKAWSTLIKTVKVKPILKRVDKLTGIGHYGVLLLGLDDVANKEGFQQPVRKGARKLKYLRPFGEQSAKIAMYENRASNERYGKPLLYEVQIQDVDNGAGMSVLVHYTRVIHITDDPLESEVTGTPRLEAPFNRLFDLEKLVGGDAEMFWRGARPGYEGKVSPDYQMTKEMKEALIEQLDEYENDLRRFLINEGVDIQALVQQIADPANHVDVQLTMISAITGIPKRILSGSERGELSSAQDSTEWKDYVQARREDFAEPNIIRPFVDRLIELEILPTPSSGDYMVKWNDLYSLSEKARVEIGKSRSNALREYTYTPLAQTIIPPKAFYEYFLGLTKEQITLVLAMCDELISEEERNAKILKAIDQEINPPKPVMAPAKPVAKAK